jgi:hypothetical protein
MTKRCIHYESSFVTCSDSIGFGGGIRGATSITSHMSRRNVRDERFGMGCGTNVSLVVACNSLVVNQAVVVPVRERCREGIVVWLLG